MWTRKGLKTYAKGVMKANYWRSVLVGFLLFFIVGVGSGSSSVTGAVGGQSLGLLSIDSVSPAGILLMMGIMVLLGLIISLAAVFVSIFLTNPLGMGCKRFFYCNLEQSAEVKELAWGFDHHYKNVVKTLFFRDLFTILWSLLFVIPGIIKSYEYKMIPYLLSEYPDMPREDAFAISKYMMDGNKWKAFVLDLSFIPWLLLTSVTFGLAGIFYVNPYMAQTEAALYDALKMEKQPFSSQTDQEDDFLKG
ncbi:MAG: DUF975 family protein [Lachnospiraceae bacterium]|nr:DUF975 family protein [Lachnospiraceae bacterium]